MRPVMRSSIVAPTKSSVSKERSDVGNRQREQELKVNAAGFCVGDSVTVTGSGYTGIARYVGPVHFAVGTWIGIELKMATGKNDGCVQGKRYFTCPQNCGLFIKAAGCNRKQTTSSRGVITTPIPRSPTKQKDPAADSNSAASLAPPVSLSFPGNLKEPKKVTPAMPEKAVIKSTINNIDKADTTLSTKKAVLKSSAAGSVSTTTSKIVATKTGPISKPVVVTRATSSLLPPPPPSTAQTMASMQKNFENLQARVVEMESKFNAVNTFMTDMSQSVRAMEKSIAQMGQYSKTQDGAEGDTSKELLIKEQQVEIEALKDSLRDINKLVDQVKSVI